MWAGTSTNFTHKRLTTTFLPRKLKTIFIEYQRNAKCYGEHRRIRSSDSYAGRECGITPKTLSRGMWNSSGLTWPLFWPHRQWRGNQPHCLKWELHNRFFFFFFKYHWLNNIISVIGMNIRFLIGKGRKQGRAHWGKLGELFPSDPVWDISFPQGENPTSKQRKRTCWAKSLSCSALRTFCIWDIHTHPPREMK